MFHSRAARVATACVAALVFPAVTAVSAGASTRIYVPWTEQTVFADGPTGNYLAEWMGLSSGWTIINNGPSGAVYAGSAGVFMTDPTTGDILMYNGTPGSWTVIGGPGSDFAEGGGHLYGLAPDGSYVAEWNGTVGGGWTIIGGPAQWITAGPDGLVAVDADWDASYYNGTPGNWTDIGVTDPGFVAVGQNAVYRADPATHTILSQWTGGTTWTPIMTTTTGAITEVVAGDVGVIVALRNSGGQDYFKYGGTPNTWSAIGDTNPIPLTESRTALYGETFDSSGLSVSVSLYEGGTTWAVIGGPTSGLAAGD